MSEGETKVEETKVETKPDETKVETKVDAKAAAETVLSPVPEKYEFKIPKDSPLKASDVEKIAAYAKAQGFSLERAQTFLDERSADKSSYRKEYTTEIEADLKTKTGQWLDQVKTDKEIGGDAFNKNVELAKRYVDRFGSDALKKELNATGLGNHPELVRMIVRAAKSMAEDELVRTKSTTTTKKSVEEALYGSTQ